MSESQTSYSDKFFVEFFFQPNIPTCIEDTRTLNGFNNVHFVRLKNFWLGWACHTFVFHRPISGFWDFESCVHPLQFSVTHCHCYWISTGGTNSHSPPTFCDGRIAASSHSYSWRKRKYRIRKPGRHSNFVRFLWLWRIW